MKTVVDFKKAGLVFVAGDIVDGSIENDGSGMKPLAPGMVSPCNNGKHNFDEAPVGAFAWRTNTGVNPGFSGMIEVEYYFNHKDFGTKVVHSDCLDWEQLTLFKKWRPHLPVAIQTETPEEKEAFEAMNKSPYDVGAHVSDASKPVLPQVGHKLKFTHDIDGAFKHLHSEVFGWEHGDNLEVIHATENHYGEDAVIVLNTQSDVLTTAVIIDPSFFDVRTELEKAIDEMVAAAVNSADDMAKSIIYEACVKLAKAGYVKPCSNNK